MTTPAPHDNTGAHLRRADFDPQRRTIEGRRHDVRRWRARSRALEMECDALKKDRAVSDAELVRLRTAVLVLAENRGSELLHKLGIKVVD